MTNIAHMNEGELELLSLLENAINQAKNVNDAEIVYVLSYLKSRHCLENNQ